MKTMTTSTPPERPGARPWGLVGNTVRYSLMNLLFLTAAAFVCLGGMWVWMGFLIAIVLLGIADEAIGDATDGENMPPRWYLNLMLYLSLPMLVLVTLVVLNVIRTDPIPGFDAAVRWLGYDTDAARARTDWLMALGAVITLGFFYGAVGINVAHELVHRIDSTFDMTIGRWLLAFTGDTGFSIEHVHGHHRNVGTEADPATARRGETVSRFVLRSTIGQWHGARQIEAARLARRGIRNTIFTNRFWRGQLMSLTILAGFVLALGWIFGPLLFVLSAGLGKAYLEVVNYIEHYGLVRIPGRPVESRHAWDSYRRVFSGLLYNLPLHSNHHRFATRPFWELKQTPEQSPLMPFGYMMTLGAAIIPPVWRRVITPRLADWDDRFASAEERAYLASKGLLLGTPRGEAAPAGEGEQRG